MKGKAILAYSGGLDTSISINWIKEKYGLDVIAALIDCGQPEDLEEAREKALDIGASESVIIDAREEFIKDYIFPAIKANIKYEKNYPLATALARPLIVKKIVGIAREEGASAIAHGCTAKGNDQVRFDVGIRSLAPDIDIIAPQRVWNLSREDAIEYAKEHNIKISVTKKSPYSIDENLWGRSIECGILEDPWREPPEDIYGWTKIQKKPGENGYIEIGFEEGVPVTVDGKKTPPLTILKDLNKLAGSYGIGRVDMVENRLIGIKSREIYESPAAEVLVEAHRQVESLVLDREMVHYKYLLEEKMSELIYYGLWFTPLRKGLSAFMDESQKYVTGVVRIKFELKNFEIVGRKSDNSLYELSLATYDKDDQFDPKHSESFIKIWGYPYEILGRKGRTNG